jgi:hypothetical protein
MRSPLVLLMIIVALVAAGCGGGGDSGGGDKSTSKEAYGKQLAAAGQTLQKTFADIGDQTGNTTSSAKIGARLKTGATALDQAVKKFEAITPPDDVKAAHAKIIAGLQEIADALRKSASAAASDDPAALNKALAALTTGDGVKKITEAQQELEAAGVTVTDKNTTN